MDDVLQAATEAFNDLWSKGHDGKELALAFVRVAAATARSECDDAGLQAMRNILA